ncbi:MAG: rod shape-determining protein MreD [Gemmatimonadaceae bacterium]|nr:rod shape-determining protein MreD [Gemmatimonadaceae bacterium]
MATAQPPSGLAAAAGAWLGFLLLVAAHFAIRPLFASRANVDFLLIAILFSAVRVRPGLAALLGLAAGFTVDALAPGSFGAAALSLVAVAFAASRVKAVFFADHVALTGLFVFVGKVAFDVVYASVSGGVRGMQLVVQLLLWTPLSAALTAAVAVILLTLFKPLYRPVTG